MYLESLFIEWGSKGKTIASNLSEQLAMQEIKANPAMGTIIIEGLKDQRWSGWDKMQYSKRLSNGSEVNIHYVGKIQNGKLVAVDDFKFK